PVVAPPPPAVTVDTGGGPSVVAAVSALDVACPSRASAPRLKPAPAPRTARKSTASTSGPALERLPREEPSAMVRRMSPRSKRRPAGYPKPPVSPRSALSSRLFGQLAERGIGGTQFLRGGG